MVSPGPLSIEPKKSRRFPHHRLAHQPVDLREGVAKAYSVVKEVGSPQVGQAALAPASWLSSTERSVVAYPKEALGVGLGLLPAVGLNVCQIRTGCVGLVDSGKSSDQWRNGLSFPADASELDRQQAGPHQLGPMHDDALLHLPQICLSNTSFQVAHSPDPISLLSSS